MSTNEKPSMTDEEYVNHPQGYVCPWCGSNNVYNTNDLEFTGDGVSQLAECLDCHKKWRNVFTLTGYSPGE